MLKIRKKNIEFELYIYRIYETNELKFDIRVHVCVNNLPPCAKF